MAFLNSQLWEKVYIKHSEFFYNDNYSQVLMLFKVFYRLKLSAHLWFDNYANKMKNSGIFQFLTIKIPIL